jgi:hypothetical protein
MNRSNIPPTTVFIITLSLFSSVHSVSGAELVSHHDYPRLGEPPQQLELDTSFPRFLYDTYEIPADRTGGWAIDPSSRQWSRAFYNSVYLASSSIASGWAGDIASCDEGDTSAEFRNSVLVRINYFRAMAGVPSDILFSAVYNDKAQQAALMMSNNGDLDHTPPANWTCYTADGAEAASRSNLSLGNYGWAAVDGQMMDNGAYNTAAGHRRWILYPQTEEMGTGDVPSSSGYFSANALWVMDGRYNNPRPATREPYVAWPPPGYIPYTVVSPRWSFSYPEADFSTASVSMSSNGSPISVVIHPPASGYGENTIVWAADGLDPDQWNARWPQPDEDTAYTVEIRDVTISGTAVDFSYNVTNIDPTTSSDDEEYAIIDGPVYPAPGQPASYTFTPVSMAESYELQQSVLQEGTYLEGGEQGGAALIDNTDASYDLLTASASASGDFSLHLAHPAAESESFELDSSFIPSATSALIFSSRLGYATDDETFMVQISRDDGRSWQTLYSESGSNGAGQSSFKTSSVSLAPFADSFVRFRFLYHFEGGGYYPSTGAEYGLLVDDLQVVDAMEVIDSAVTPLGAEQEFSFTKESARPCALSIRAVPWNGYPAVDWGPLFYLPATPERVELGDAIEMLNALAAGSTQYTLNDVIEVLQVLTGR